MDDVINGTWLSDESLCIALSRDLLESGAEIQITVDSISGAFRIRSTALLDENAKDTYLN